MMSDNEYYKELISISLGNKNKLLNFIAEIKKQSFISGYNNCMDRNGLKKTIKI